MAVKYKNVLSINPKLERRDRVMGHWEERVESWNMKSAVI